MSIIIKPLWIAKNVLVGAVGVITNHDVVFFVFKQTLCASASGACMGSAIALTHYGYTAIGACFYSLGAIIFIAACVIAYRFIVSRVAPSPKKEPVVVARATTTDTVTETIRLRVLPECNRFPDMATERTALRRIDLSETPRHRMYKQPDAEQFVLDRLSSLDPDSHGYDEVDAPRLSSPARIPMPSNSLVAARVYFEQAMLATGREVVVELSRTATRATSVDRVMSDEQLVIAGGKAMFRVLSKEVSSFINRRFNIFADEKLYEPKDVVFSVKTTKDEEAEKLSIEGVK